MGKVNTEPVLLLNNFVVSHLATIVERQGLTVTLWYGPEARFGSLSEDGRRRVLELDSQEVPALALNEGSQVTTVATTNDGVTLPMAEAITFHDMSWALGDPAWLLELVTEGPTDGIGSSSSVLAFAAVQMDE